MKVWKKYFILAAVCAVFGIITGSLFRSSYFDTLKEIVDIYFENISICYDSLSSAELLHMFVRILTKRISPFAILWLLSGIEFVRVYMAWLFVKWGYIFGFLVSFIVQAYKVSSIGIIAAWFMPQVLVYAIVYFCSMIYIMNNYSRKKWLIITLLSLLMIAGCACETYVNPMLIRMVI